MTINRELLNKAVDQGVLRADQVDALWTFISEQEHVQAHDDAPSFRFTHILYYFGGLVAIGAMTLFMTLGWERFGGWGLLAIALTYAAAGLWLTQCLLYRQRLQIPAGISATFVVALVPLAIYGLQVALGFWPEGGAYRNCHSLIDWRWIFMELGTLAAGAVMLWRYRLPFLVMPIAATLWYMSMDLVQFVFFQTPVDWGMRKFISLWFGLLMVLLAFWVDARTRQSKDYAYWLYLFGVVAFWTGLSLMQSDSEWRKFIYLCINLVMVVVGAILSRRVFAVFGGLGVAGYIAQLAHGVFKDSMVFPFVLTAIGLGIVYLGILWQRHEKRISLQLRALLPAPIRQLIERRH